MKLFPLSASRRLIALLGAAFAMASGAQAQSFDGTWFTLDGGGGLSAGGSYSIESSISPSDAGMITGGSYSLTGSFWSAPADPSSGDPPRLEIVRNAAGLVLSWPFPSEGWSLEQTDELSQPLVGTVWSNAALPSPVRDGALWKITMPAGAGRSFFRLRFP